ncbi:MAG: hypothetical protein WD669_11775 [Pirellulales bacterium]
MRPTSGQSQILQLAFCNSKVPAFGLSLFALLAIATTSPAAIRVEAYRGQPFGVGRVTIDLPQGAPSTPWSDDRFAIEGEQDRVLYPVIENAPVRRLLRRFLDIETPWRVTFFFMFRGDEPLSMTVHTPSPERFTIQPRDNPSKYRDLVDEWWDATTSRYQSVYRQAEYPVVVENFVTATWARRLAREMPEPGTFLLRNRETGGTWIAQLTAAEAYQTAVERDLLLGRFGVAQEANLPLPATDFRPANIKQRTADELPAPNRQPPAPIEPIAGRVPQECFYMRFGNFTNYLWFRDFMRKWQGDLGNMIILESVSHDNRERLQQQLALRESQIARVMGPTVINDVAVIGLDAYMRDGAAMGILFHAKNIGLLSRNITGGRSEALQKNSDATETKVDIAGHEVSYLSTPDGRLRSYYATDGDYLLVSRSRRLVERFYETAAGNGSLAATAQFQSTRTQMPLDREDTIFLYLSAEFFEHLASPPYRVELDRRLRSIGEMRSLQMARLAARTEGRDARTVDELVAADLLPAGFGQHPDGSQLQETDAGWRDSLRGMSGSLVPVADMQVDKITPAEAQRYAAFRRTIDGEVGRFAPVVAALKRQASPKGNEWDRITADVRLAPYSQTNLVQFANRLGPAPRLRVAPIGGDVASIELVLSGFGEPLHAFAGLRDFRTPFMVRQGEARPALDWSQFASGYLGVWPRLHLLDTFLGSPTSAFDRNGIARNNRLFDLWLRRADDFFLFAFQREVLMEVGPQLAMVEAERPAQVRLHVDDLSNKQIATTVSGFGYSRARAATASGSRFMNSLVAQLHVSPEEARKIGEQLVGGKFVSPLGGEYELVTPSLQAGESLPTPGERKLWASTATPTANRFLLTEIPADYRMPMLEWFRGLDFDLTRNDAADALTAHAELDMVHQDVTPPAENGNGAGGASAGGLNLGGLGDLLNGLSGKKEEAKPPADAKQSPAELPPPREIK